MPDDWDSVRAAVDARSVYVEPLPFNETIESVGVIFSAYGTVNQVRLTRILDPEVKGGVFAGSATIEMATQEAAKMLIDGTLEHAGATLRVQSKQAYQDARTSVRNWRNAAAC